MKLYEELKTQAQALGFARLRVVAPEPLPVVRSHPQTDALESDPKAVLPSVKSVIVLLWSYAPYAEGDALLDAYYPASNAAHQAAIELQNWLIEKGYRADMRAPIPRKPLAARSGLGSYGRNSLIAAENFGSWISIQCVLTDAELPLDPTREIIGLSEMCLHCRACVNACPTGALDGTGHVDLQKCLRAQPESEPVREELRWAMGGSLLGCNRCQSVCPRNKLVGAVSLPQALAQALALPALLRGEYRPLIPYLGKNNARKMRIQARACLIAAHRKRHDLLCEIEPLCQSENEAVRQHAQWALRFLEEIVSD